MSVDSSAAGLGHGEQWFVVLPDCEAAAAVARGLETGLGPYVASQRVDHPSGRPWLIGRWEPGELLVGSAGRVRVAVLGCCPASAEEITGIAHRISGIGGLDRVAGTLEGSVHLAASVDGAVRVQGSVSGVRRVFHTRLGEVTVAADRTDILAQLTGAAPDEHRLVACLLFPAPPPALTDVPLWQGIAAVPEDHYLLLTGRQPARAVRWWQPPHPVLSLQQGAPVLREALSAAVRTRMRSGRTVSADLSGGLDSTTICALAATELDHLLTYTVTGADPADDDAFWADIAAAELPGMRRVVVTDEDLPVPYADILRPGIAREEPYPDIHLRAEDSARARLLASHGAQLHLTGDGGDEIVQAATFSYLPELLRAQPWTGYRHLQGLRALHRWSWPQAWRVVSAPYDERRTLLAQAHALQAGVAGDTHLPDSVSLPPWATPDAVHAARELLIRAAQDTVPETSAVSTAQRDIVRVIRHGGRLMRRIALTAAADGLPVAAPFLDDRVIEACLSVRIHERTTPWRYKPLLVEAMRGVVPARSLTRTTKGGTSPDYAALPRFRADLLALCENARLAQRGLIDLDRLRTALAGAWTSDAMAIMVEQTMGCERWLRDLDQPALPAGVVKGELG